MMLKRGGVEQNPGPIACRGRLNNSSTMENVPNMTEGQKQQTIEIEESEEEEA